MKKIDIRKTVLFRDIKNLLIAAYYLGQQRGLEKMAYTHPTARKERENIVDILLKDI